MADFSPESFGKYYLIDKIAVGGMAEIFKAKTYSHGGFENLLVIKRILNHLGDNDEFVEMFIDEAKVSVALQHPNVVRIFDFGKILDNYFIAMECVEGKDVRGVLRKLSKARAFLPLEFAAFIIHEAAKGLEYAHKKTDVQGRHYGIVHRDISPSNILVSYEGQVKVADFGIAKAESNSYQTRDGVLKGKFEYMSPEQVEGRPLTSQSDIFALGIILWEMSTGHRLFKTGNDVLTLNKIKRCDFDDPSAVNPRVPDELEEIIIKALARDPAHRYQTAGELRNDLANFMAPKNTDELHAELETFMHELFADDMAAELGRLETGSALAEKMHADAPPDQTWEVTNTLTQSEPQPRSLWPWLVALVPVLLLFPLLLGTVGLLAWVITQPDPVEDVATLGSLDVRVNTEAKLTLDGTDRGANTRFLIEELEPGEHQVKLEAAGYQVWEFPIDVVAGSKTTENVQLLKEGEVAPPTGPGKTSKGTPKPAGKPAVVVFGSAPDGADVYVNGSRVGSTPMRWDGASGGRSYNVEMRLDGHKSASGKLSGLVGGQAKNYSLTLEPKATEPGTLTVVVVGVGWANVYVDGQKLDKTAPLRDLPLPAGSHSIRVENAAMGLDHTETITIKGGANSTVRASP